MSAYIPVPDPLTPAWLTAVLHQSGTLAKEVQVTAVEQQTIVALNSRTSRLTLHYSLAPLPETPSQLILKQNLPLDWGMEAGADEVKFYSLIASLPIRPPALVPCYAAAYDEANGNSYLLLQDLSETHHPPITRDQQISRAIPPEPSLQSVIEALGQFHAYWWNHPLQDTPTFEIGHWSRDEQQFAQYLQRRQTSWQALITDETWLPQDISAIYAQVFAHLPRYWERYLKPRFQPKNHLTLVHGDAYFCNFLCPRQPDKGETYLLDWQSPEFEIGAYDLVNMYATFWTSEQRHTAQREEKILRHYHTTLLAHGVSNYSWPDLLTDYQMGIIYWLLMPVQDRFGGSPKSYWWPKMQSLVAAFRDWHCEKLLA